jgi:hypothetical protein
MERERAHLVFLISPLVECMMQRMTATKISIYIYIYIYIYIFHVKFSCIIVYSL